MSHGCQEASLQDCLFVRAGRAWVFFHGYDCGRTIGEHQALVQEVKRVPKKKSPAQKTKVIDPDRNNEGKLKSMGGSQSDDWNNILAIQAIQALWLKNSDEETKDLQLTGNVAALEGIAPRDELEGMMAAQLLAAHNAAMECYRRAMLPDQTFEGRNQNLNHATKLSRTWATLLNTLNKHRGKGQQKVTVEHVHVHEGGQAIVGTVEHPGGGAKGKVEEQPHAKQIAHAPQPTLRGTDESENAVPIPRNAER